MFAKQESFEVHACRDGRWTIETTTTTQPDAEALDRKASSRQGVSGVRGVREVARGDSARASVVFQPTWVLRDGGKILVKDRKSAEQGKRESERGNLGGCCRLRKKKITIKEV